MAKAVKERVSEHRERLRQAGMATVSIVIPSGDVHFFRDLAQQARSSRTRVLRSNQNAASQPGRGRLSPSQLRMAERWATQTGLRLRLSGIGMKLGELLARNIAHEIAMAGWPVGRNLGTEAELMKRFGISRSILREAIRSLEFQSIAVMKRGVGGGLIVCEPTRESATFACGNFLESRHFSVEGMFRTRIALEFDLLERCIDGLDESSKSALTRQVLCESELDEHASGSDLQRFHMLLAELSGDTSAVLFMDVLLRMTRFHSKYFRMNSRERLAVVDAVRTAHAAITQAIFSGRFDQARHEMKRHLTAIAKKTSAVVR